MRRSIPGRDCLTALSTVVCVLSIDALVPHAVVRLEATAVTMTAGVVPGPLPAPWSDQDVGSVGSTGRVSYANGVFTLQGAGTIWGTSDTFHLVSQPISGDFTIVAHVTGIQNTDTFAKAGLVIRESAAPDAAHVILDLRPTSELEFMIRPATGAATTFLATAPSLAPTRLRLQRAGTTVIASVAPDVGGWTTLGSTTLNIGPDALVGLAVGSNTAGLNTSTFDSVTITHDTGLPSPWTDQDIGPVGTRGSGSSSDSGFTVNGAGTIWGTSDTFNFLEQPIAGDVTIVAQVSTIQNTDPFAKAGIMIRESNAPNAAHVILNLRPTGDLEFMTRPSTGSGTTFLGTGRPSGVGLLRLVRQGTIITAAVSSGDNTWTTLGATTLNIGGQAWVGLVVGSNSSGLNTSTFADVLVSAGPGGGGLPPLWADQDVGRVGTSGSVAYANGQFTISGAGTIWGNSDAFNVVEQPVSGDTTIVARVMIPKNQTADPFGKAGLMIRESNAANAAHVILDVRPTGDLEFMTRPSTGAATTFLGTASNVDWIRLVRRGATVTASASADGNLWTTIGSTTFNIGPSALVGLVVGSNTSGPLQAAFDNLTVLAMRRSAGVWLTTPDQRNLLAPQSFIDFAERPGSNPLTIDVDPATRYQQIDGFGATVTDSSAWLIFTALPEDARSRLMTALFDANQGIGLSYLRVPMGASDFALSYYTYDDLPAGQTDPTLANFSIAHDEPYILPVLRQALEINPQIRVIATPWSPPAWMKWGGSLTGGWINTDSTTMSALANYFVEFIQRYTAAGVPIDRVSPQNEPLVQTTSSPSAYMAPDVQETFISAYLGPALRAAHLSTAIAAYDQNWTDTTYAETVLGGPAAAYVSGSAWHCYGGSPDAMTIVHDAFPASDIYFTECSNTSPTASFSATLLQEVETLVIGVPRNWSRIVLMWNLALDPNNGPHVGGCDTCTGLATIDPSASVPTVTFNVDYFALGHISKFVHPGAYRIASNTFGPGSIEDVAFINPDGSEVVIVLNADTTDHAVTIRQGTESFTATLPAGSVATYTW